jgi:hypothetical protein
MMAERGSAVNWKWLVIGDSWLVEEVDSWKLKGKVGKVVGAITDYRLGREVEHGGPFVVSVEFGAGQVKEDLLGLAAVSLFDGAMGMEELARDESENGSAARPNAALDYLNQKASQELANVGGRREFGGFGKELRGEVFEVVGSRCGQGFGHAGVQKVARAEAGLRAAEAAAAAIGIEVLAAGGIVLWRSDRDCDGGDRISDCGVHDFPLCRGYPPHCCKDLKTKELRIGQCVSDWKEREWCVVPGLKRGKDGKWKSEEVTGE